jgi:hypothetical protein
VDERFREALRRNALLAELLADDAPRDLALFHRELSRVRRRRVELRAGSVAAAAALLAAAFWRPAPAPPPSLPPARVVKAPPFQVLRTADVAASLELVRTPAGAAFEIVRTEDVGLELAGDAELLGTPRTAAIVGHPGGPRRLIVAP